MKIFQFYFLGVCLLCMACGGGDISIDRTMGNESSAGNSLAYFTNTIFPLLISDRTGFTGGCAGTSGCHFKGNAAQTGQTFYQVNALSASESANWAMARRSAVTTGTYAATNSITLKTRKNSDHQSFTRWTTDEKTTLDKWTALTQ